MKKIAFDIDDTIYKITTVKCPDNCVLRHYPHERTAQVPDYRLIDVLFWFYNNGDDVIVWSAGGIDYAGMIVEKLGLSDYCRVISKGSESVDLTFDDMEVDMGDANIQVKR